MERKKHSEIERSIIKKYRKTIWRGFIKGIQKYDLIKENDKIAVCISGGKDSMLLAKLIIDCLHGAGYKNKIKADNGQEAWSYLQEIKKHNEPIRKHVACIVSDIEMPLMDGHRLTKLVKEDPILSPTPLILFSSLISDEMRQKGIELGADAQITKPEIAELVRLIDELTNR